eukprot:gene5264-6555_t
MQSECESYQKLQSQAKNAVIKRSVTYSDWPVRGVGFLDISPLFLSYQDFDSVLQYWQYRFKDVNLVVGLEARGFILGSAFSQRMKLPMMMMRKKGKLPGTTLCESYCKEYGRDEFEVQEDILSHLSPSPQSQPNKTFHVLIMDDILATGGTLSASIELVRKLLLLHKIENFKISTSLISCIKVLDGKEKIYEKYNDVKTIFSLSSGVGKSGVAIIRVSGPESKNVLKELTKKCHDNPVPRLATLTSIYHPETNEQLDKAMYLWFPSPNSFTGEDVVEFHVHGGKAVISDTLEAISVVPGTRVSKPGEFTMRAFENGKMDLTQVEGLSDLLNSTTQHQRKVALSQMQGSVGKFYYRLRDELIKSSAHMEAFIDFGDDAELDPEIVEQSKSRIEQIKNKITQHLNDGRRGERLKYGAQMVIIGPPNAGKSSLINLLANRKAAIVSPIPGTTRDVIEVGLDIGGYPVVIGDTAGIRLSPSDAIEQEGVEMAKERFLNSEIKLAVFDCLELLSNGIDPMLLDMIDSKTIFILNKIELVKDNPIWNETRSSLTSTIKHNISKNENQLNNSTTTTINPIIIEMSCLENIGLKNLLDSLEIILKDLFDMSSADSDAPLLTRVRYKQHLKDCEQALENYLYYFENDIVLASEELRFAIKSIGEITHSVNLDELLDVVFSDFCIGK